MYLMYVDESGDTGLNRSPTRFFILTAIVVHELRWRDTLDSLVDFRRMLRDTKGLKLREEIHANEMISKPGDLIRIKRNDRLDILKKCIDWVNDQPDLNVFSVVIDKQGKGETTDIFGVAWNTLINRFENTLRNRNFSGPGNSDERGMIVADNTDGLQLRQLVRRMRHYNAIPNNRRYYGEGYRNSKMLHVIEDPVFRDSKQSLILQMNDVLAYCCRQLYEPNNYMKSKGGHNFYQRLSNVIVRQVSSKNNLGIVER